MRNKPLPLHTALNLRVRRRQLGTDRSASHAVLRTNGHSALLSVETGGDDLAVVSCSRLSAMPAAMFKFRRLERTCGEVAAVVARCGETSLPDLSGWTATRDGQSSRSTSRHVHWCGLCWRQRDANGNFWGDGACKVTHAWAGMRDCFALATECGRARASRLLVAAFPDLTLFRLPHSFSCTILRNPAPLRPSLRLPLCRLPVVLWTSAFLLPICTLSCRHATPRHN